MEILNTWWMCAISIVVSFVAVFIVSHNSKWPNSTMWGVLIGTVIGLAMLTYIPYMTILLLCFSLGTFVGFLIQKINNSVKNNVNE